MYKFLRTYGLVCLASMIADFFYTLYVLSVAQDNVILALLTGSAIPFVQFIGSAMFVEAETTKERFYITIATAVGMFIGSAITLLAFGSGKP